MSGVGVGTGSEVARVLSRCLCQSVSFLSHHVFIKMSNVATLPCACRQSVLFIGTRFSNLYTAVDTPAEAEPDSLPLSPTLKGEGRGCAKIDTDRRGQSTQHHEVLYLQQFCFDLLYPSRCCLQGIEGLPGVAAPVFHEEQLYEVESEERDESCHPHFARFRTAVYVECGDGGHGWGGAAGKGARGGGSYLG